MTPELASINAVNIFNTASKVNLNGLHSLQNISLHIFQYGTGLEKNKLFVKNLPFTITKEALNTMFEEVFSWLGLLV